MSVTLQRAAPQDLAAGILVVRYQQADFRAIFQRLHLSTDVPADIAAEFERYAAIVKAYYDSTWNLDLTAAFRVAAGTPQRIPVPAAATVPGTSSTATTGLAGVIQKIFSFDTENIGGKGRLRFEAYGGATIGADDTVSSSTGGSATDQALVAYVTGTTTLIRGRDGTRLQAPAGLTYDLVKRDRAKGRRKL